MKGAKIDVRLFVGQVPKTWDDAMTLKYFHRFGSILEARIIRDKGIHTTSNAGTHKGCAFLRCAYFHEAELIMKAHKTAQRRRKNSHKK